MHEAIFNLKPCQAVIIADFKENFQAEYNRDQESQEFFKKHPVTCLSFVVHIMSAKQQHIKVVYTILSKCHTHNAQFVIRALRRIFREPEFRGLSAIHWWSDGAGHFRNTALLDVLLEKRKGKQMLLNCEIDVSYFCAAHGKSECDSCFGYFSRLLKQSTPVDGIKSLQDLVNFFEVETASKTEFDSSSKPQYRFINFTCARLAKKSKKIEMNGFKESLHFSSQDGMIISSRLTNAEEKDKKTQILKTKIEESDRQGVCLSISPLSVSTQGFCLSCISRKSYGKECGTILVYKVLRLSFNDIR
ncbi:MAG: hypothetical protein EZS28_005616 [Streblomastix strix]|uniref:Uncharacterized protein n=1 Tax=Streblomastix strix TaxID=222440 RepID=A0A5J4WWY8_9EUKA|nr:MAG: hypothetical protein EZS28_005616 [Streblomastix strix]